MSFDLRQGDATDVLTSMASESEAVPEAHFATFPVRLAERCILAGCAVGGLVLDPFAGLATAGMAALKHGRRFLGVELNAEYIRLAEARLERVLPLFSPQKSS